MSVVCWKTLVESHVLFMLVVGRPWWSHLFCVCCLLEDLGGVIYFVSVVCGKTLVESYVLCVYAHFDLSFIQTFS